jgi:putative zinc finger/helix-turn-helix YgiT family protein
MSKQPKPCRACGGVTKTEAENYRYTESGLPNVVLLGVNVRRCPKCGEVELLLPRVAELHRVIARAVVHKPARLTGAEVRFLRKHLGWSGTDFAEHMGVDPTTVSAWENDRKQLGPSSDRLLRLMVVHKAPVDDYSLEELKKITDHEEAASSRRFEIRPQDHGWQVSASP